MSQQHQPSTLAPYHRNRINHSELGTEYEKKVSLFALLNLSDGQHLAVEMKDAPKFDDLVLFIEPSAQPKQHGFYFRQLKHNQNPSQQINWDDLFREKKSKYYLPPYYEKFCEILNNPVFCDPNDAQINWIRELSIMTNIGFDSNTLNTHFDEVTADSVWGIMAHKPDAKRYKLNKQLAMSALKKHNLKMNDADKFFELLVFEVNYPGVDTMDQELKTKMKLFFPSYNDQEIEEATTTFKEKGLSLFNTVCSNNTANWITSSDRNGVFVSITPRIISFGLRSVIGETYEQTVLQPLHKTIEFSDTYNCPQTVDQLLKELPDTVNVVNIFCDPKETLPTIASLKVYKYLLSSVNNGDGDTTSKRLEIMRVNNSDQMVKILNSIGKHGYEPSEKFLVVIEVASDIGGSDFLNAMASSGIIGKLQSWKNMKLVVISDKDFSKEIPSNVTTDDFNIKTISDNLLEWRDLCFDTRVFLFENKTLFIEGNKKEAFEAWRKQSNNETSNNESSAEMKETVDCSNRWTTSLKSLGLSNNTDEGWVDSLSLAELILHNEQRPLCLGLPKYDSDLDTMYIDRKIKLPLFNTAKQNTKETNDEVMKVNTNGEESKEMSEELKQRLVYIEKACREEMRRKKDSRTRPFHLLTPVDSSVKGSHLWLTSSNERTEDNYAELKDHMIRSSDSDYELKTESELLFKENVSSFGTLSASDDKLVIVVDYPGKGKTYLLSNLTNQFLKRQSKEEKLIESLILRVNLLDVQASAWQNKSIKKGNPAESNHQTDGAERTNSLTFFKDEVTATDFLVDSSVSFENDHRTANKNLSQQIIKQMCLNESRASVFVLFDGFDEISDKQRSVIYDLTNRLVMNAKGIKRIILTSRPDNGLEDKLQGHFKQFVLHLRNFDENDQIEYLEKRWNAKLHEIENGEIALERTIQQQQASDVRKYAAALVKYSKKALKDEHRSFLDIPLQCMIVAEVFYKSLDEYLEKCRNNQAIAEDDAEFHKENFAILRLYEQFYETKIDILLENKAKLSRIDENDEIAYFLKHILKQSFTLAVQRLSIFHMMQDIKHAELLCRIKWETYRNSRYREDLEQARRLGLTRAVDESQTIIETLKAPHVKFIHRTFAEYFLAGSFIETKSKLMDNDFCPTKVVNQTYKIIIDNIAQHPEYAGVMRFFDKMLANHVPNFVQNDEQLCPFALDKRDDVLKKWPALTHGKFNSFLVQALTSPCSDMFKKWTDDTIPIEDDFVMEMKEMHYKREGWLLSFLLDVGNSLLLTTLLMGCLKEYASRRDVSNEEREALAHSVTLISLTWTSTRNSYEEDELRKMTLFLQWFDPVVGLSDSENRAFSKWFLKLLTGIRGISPSKLATFSLACARMKYHRHSVPNFENLVKSIFDTCFLKTDIANTFFNLTVAATSEVPKIGAQFRDVLSLVTLVSPDDSSRLLKLQVDWFLPQGVKYIKYLNEIVQQGAELRSYRMRIINPFTIIETMEFLLKQLDEQMNGLSVIRNDASSAAAAAALETKQTIVQSAWNYLVEVLPLFVRIISPECEEAKIDPDGVSLVIRELIVPSLLWHLLASDHLPIICQRQQHTEHQTDDGDKLNRKAFLEIFFTPVGRSVMIAFADASCCKCAHRQVEEWNRSKEGCKKSVIFFPSGMYKSEETRKQFNKWLKNNLEIVWQEKTEIEFINFLVKNELKLVNDAVKWPEQEEYQLNALPCLLLSDMVSAYIPRRLSQRGLEYFEKTIKNVHLPKHQKSLWDSITQHDSNCNHDKQAERFKEEFEKRKQELQQELLSVSSNGEQTATER